MIKTLGLIKPHFLRIAYLCRIIQIFLCSIVHFFFFNYVWHIHILLPFNYLGRSGDEADMAGIALYLASRAGAWITGSIIKVDGGMTLHGKELGKKYAIAAKSKL